jgi:NADH:ubiquinone oxidoreductase subunit 4 (subunit M)
MIEIIGGILLVILWFIAAGKSLLWFTDNGSGDLRAWVSGGFAVVMLAFALNAMVEYEQENPCVNYESRLTYNAATKTMMPMRVCVERGEWEVGNE